ncbi:MAG: Holliday junction resolvase RecU [Coprobacillus sp.]|nr:Holliday junction resolvase RecU [Coprobacillus sp.]
MIRYPDGREYKNSQTKKTYNKKGSEANRGMNLEDDINASNEWYRDQDVCVITKRPTPINIVKVDYSKGARITDAYFEKQSTTDYNGVYKGRYIDFEAKNTKSRTSFPFANIELHQIEHLERVLRHGGIAFFIIEFELKDEVYLIDAKYIIERYRNGPKKSLSYEEIKEKGILVERSYNPRLKYMDAVEKIYFSE